MKAQRNPFIYGRPIRRGEDLADRGREKQDLMRDIRSGQAVMIYAPRRYGKTSLARVVAEQLWAEDGIPSVYADLWGVRSITDIVGVMGEAYSKAPGLVRVRRSLAELLRSIGFEVNLGGVLRVRYETGKHEGSERQALRELLRIPGRMAAKSTAGRLLLILDEFGELHNVPGEPDAVMRSVFQDSPDVSFIFMGSKRSLMDALFVDRRRPFYNFGRRMELGRLPYDELGDFIEEKFKAAGSGINPAGVDALLDLTGGHPYRAQQLAFHTFNLTPSGGDADEETIAAAKEEALDETDAEFRAILDGMSSARRAVYVAICKEPTTELHSRPYMERHGIRGSGSVRSALRSLVDSGEVEIKRKLPMPTDPLFEIWVRERLSPFSGDF